MSANNPASQARTATRESAFEDLANESSKIVDDARDLGRRAVSTAGHAVDALKGEGAAALSAGRKKAEAYKGRFDDLVSEHPAKTVLIAVGVGALVGFAFGRMRN